MLHFDALLNTLPIVLYGMCGIFLVILIIYLLVVIMNKATNRNKPE